MIPALIIFCCLVVMPIERGKFWRCVALWMVISMAIQALLFVVDLEGKK